MSTIGSVGSMSSAWASAGSSRSTAMKEKMFSKVDSDGSGGVDATELQTMLDKVASKSGGTSTDATELLTQMDSDSSGSLSQDELEAGMKSLMPPPSSTMQFAQQRGMGDGPPPGPPPDGPPPGPPPDGPPPGPPPDGPPPGVGSSNATSATSATSDTDNSSLDPLDTNGDGKVSAAEQLVGDLQALVKAMDGNGDGNVASTEVTSFLSQLQAGSSGDSAQISAGTDSSSTSSDDRASGGRSRMDMAAMLGALVQEAYGRIASQSTTAASLNVAA